MNKGLLSFFHYRDISFQTIPEWMMNHRGIFRLTEIQLLVNENDYSTS